MLKLMPIQLCTGGGKYGMEKRETTSTTNNRNDNPNMEHTYAHNVYRINPFVYLFIVVLCFLVNERKLYLLCDENRRRTQSQFKDGQQWTHEYTLGPIQC